MALRLVYHGQTSVPVEVAGLLPSAVRDLSLDAILRLSIYHGNRRVPLTEFFQISGDPSDMQWQFEGDLSGVHWIGAGLDGGSIEIIGDAGRHVGSQMKSGEINVTGDAGDFAGVEMRGGQIRIRGNAGNLVGATYPGSRVGMRGGVILIDGNVGDEVGRSMRRGLIAVGGQTGTAPGYGMIAGTLVISGRCGKWPAANMRRGTVIVTAGDAPALLPSFRRACRRQPEFLPLVLAELDRLGFSTPPTNHTPRDYDIYVGDLLSVGKGEILIRAPE